MPVKVGSRQVLKRYIGAREVQKVMARGGIVHYVPTDLILLANARTSSKHSTVSCGRVSNGMARNKDGSWSAVPAKTIRYGWDASGTKRVIHVEPWATNLVSTAVPGNGVVDTGEVKTVGDIQFKRYRVPATQASIDYTLNFDVSVGSSVGGQQFTGSVFIESSKSFGIGIGEGGFALFMYDSGVTDVAYKEIAVEANKVSRHDFSRTFAPGATTTGLTFRVDFPQVLNEDLFVWIGCPQVERGVMTSPVPTNGTPATRTDDLLTVDNTALGVSDATGRTIVVRAAIFNDSDGGILEDGSTGGAEVKGGGFVQYSDCIQAAGSARSMVAGSAITCVFSASQSWITAVQQGSSEGVTGTDGSSIGATDRILRNMVAELEFVAILKRAEEAAGRAALVNLEEI